MTTLLVVQHEDECPPGMLGRWWAEEGVTLDVRRPYAGEPLPPDLAGHDGLVVLGGHMGADDDADHAWLAPTKQLVRVAAAGGGPALGVGLG
ncbi:MAG: type 1 glutamine amidotransferase, partial [Nocardioides sp.]